MRFEIGERVIFRSLHWEVADNSSDLYLEFEPVILPDGHTEEEVLLDMIQRAEQIPHGEEAKVRALLDLLEKQLSEQKVIV